MANSKRVSVRKLGTLSRLSINTKFRRSKKLRNRRTRGGVWSKSLGVLRLTLLYAAITNNMKDFNSDIKYANNKNINIVDTIEGRTALIWAAYNNNLEMVKALLKKGADVNVVEKNEGKTALIWAAYNENLEMVEALLEKGANREIEAKNGKRAIDYATGKIKDILMDKASTFK